MKILVKFPSRQRPDKFKSVLQQYIDMSINKDIQYLVSLDGNDPTLSKYHENLSTMLDTNKIIAEGKSGGKIFAINRDMELAGKWDILLLASDDMIPQVQGWDERIKKDMEEHFPDGDGVLYYFDGHQKLNTMPIMGRKYYERFNYIYHPEYISLFCDNEFEEVADILGKQVKFSDVLFRHECWFNGPQYAHTNDQLQRINQSYYQADHLTYIRRKSINFGI